MVMTSQIPFSSDVINMEVAKWECKYCIEGKVFLWHFLFHLISSCQLQLQKSQYLQLGPNRGLYYGGSLPNVNQIGNATVEVTFQVRHRFPVVDLTTQKGEGIFNQIGILRLYSGHYLGMVDSLHFCKSKYITVNLEPTWVSALWSPLGCVQWLCVDSHLPQCDLS